MHRVTEENYFSQDELELEEKIVENKGIIMIVFMVATLFFL